MYDPNAIAGVPSPLPNIIRELEVSRLLRFRFACNAEKILRFVDHDERCVFKEDLHSRRQHGFRDGDKVGADSDYITGQKAVIKLSDRAVVHGHGLKL